MEIIIQKKILYPEILWKRPVHYYKNQAGRVLILAGSRDKSRTALLATEAAFRSGTGILTLGFPEGLKTLYKGLLPEAMTLPLPETPGYSLSKKAESQILDYTQFVDAVILGPGLSKNPETQQLIWELIFGIKKTIILDTDALSSFSLGLKILFDDAGVEGIKNYLRKRKNPSILILDPGEVLKILKVIGYKPAGENKVTNKYIDENSKKIAPFVADFLGMYVVLVDRNIVVAEPEGRVVLTKKENIEIFSEPRYGVLSGIIGSFVAQNPKSILEAVSTAVYLYTAAEELVKKDKERKVFASDIIKKLPQAIKEAEEDLE